MNSGFKSKLLNISIDILCFVTNKPVVSSYVRSPTLDTVLMVEKTIEQHSGEFNRTELWKLLPKKVMWQTYVVILDYLTSINKIAFDVNGIIGYIWNPSLAKQLRKRRGINL